MSGARCSSSAQTNATHSLLRAVALALGQPWRPTWSKVSRERETALRVTVGGKYLPSNVWLAQSFVQDQVDRCQDWEDNDTLGRCYRLSVKEVSQSSVLQTVHQEVVNRVKEVAKNRKDSNKTWDVQTSSCCNNSTSEAQASKKFEKELAKANKAVLALAVKVLTPVTNNWLKTELALKKTPHYVCGPQRVPRCAPQLENGLRERAGSEGERRLPRPHAEGREGRAQGCA